VNRPVRFFLSGGPVRVKRRKECGKTSSHEFLLGRAGLVQIRPHFGFPVCADMS
jgi:hypothetical protein